MTVSLVGAIAKNHGLGGVRLWMVVDVVDSSPLFDSAIPRTTQLWP